MLRLALSVLCGALCLATAAAAAVTITPDGAGFAIATEVYAAKVDGQGALSSLAINGQEFLAPPTQLIWADQGGMTTGVYASPMNQFYVILPLPGTPTVAENTVTAEGHGWKIAYAFGPDTIDLTYSGTPEGTKLGFRAGYPPAELYLSLAHDLDRACDPDNQGELGWPVVRPHEPGVFTILAKNGAGFTATDVCRMQAVTSDPNLPAAPHRLDLMVFNTYDQIPQPITHRLTCFTKADLAHSLTMEITSPNPGHLFPAPEPVTFPVKVNALYGHTLSGTLNFNGSPYVWQKPPLTAEVPLTLTAEQPSQTVQLPIVPQKPGHYTGKIEVSEGGKALYSQRLGFIYRPEQIPPATPPADFDKFWDDTLAELAKVPLDLTLEEQVDKATPTGKVYKAKYRSWQGKWAWAWLYVPTDGSKQVDGFLRLPPVSVWQPPPPNLVPPDGSLTMAVAIHGGDVGDYPAKPEGGFDYMMTGITSRETYALRYAYCCVARCYDILKARPECNGTIHARGGSQGAGLTFVAAGLRPVTDAAGAAIALCRIDWTVLGYASWGPHAPEGTDPQEIAKVVAYFDPANFAHRIHAPMRLALGLFDFCAPAEGIFTAINALPPDTKCEVFVDPFGGHFTLNATGFNAGEPGVQVPRWQGTAEENKLNK
ncbi:MAG TPA: acetylxylan esterase [Armatimonadota bacterium]|jgi:cephalosporin-C deacetylase